MRAANVHLYSDEEGSSLIELALCAMVVFLVLLGIMECSRAIYVDHFVHSAARDGARYAMVRGSSWPTGCSSTTMPGCDALPTDVAAYVQSTAPPGVVPSSIVVKTTWIGKSASGSVCDTDAGNNSPGCVVTVQVTYPFTFLLPLSGNTAFQIQGSSSTTISQ